MTHNDVHKFPLHTHVCTDASDADSYSSNYSAISTSGQSTMVFDHQAMTSQLKKNNSHPRELNLGSLSLVQEVPTPQLLCLNRPPGAENEDFCNARRGFVFLYKKTYYFQLIQDFLICFAKVTNGWFSYRVYNYLSL